MIIFNFFDDYYPGMEIVYYVFSSVDIMADFLTKNRAILYFSDDAAADFL
jgi:hypothetical protein